MKKVSFKLIRFVKILSTVIVLLAMLDLILGSAFCPFSREIAVAGSGIYALYDFAKCLKITRINKEHPMSKIRVNAKYFLYLGMNCIALAVFFIFYGQDYVPANIFCALACLSAAFTLGLAIKHSSLMKKF